MIPSNYEWIINFLKRLREKEPKALADVKRIRDDYQRIVARGHGVLAIPEHVPITFGQSTWLTIGEKYIVLALRSEKVRTYPGYYHMIGGVPFHAKPRRATNKMLRQNVTEELRDELGVTGKKFTFGKPLGTHITLEPEGLGLNVVQPAKLGVDAESFIRNHFRPIDPKNADKGYSLKTSPSEAWEATHFMLIPNNPTALRAFYHRNKGKMTPVLKYTIERILD